MAKNLVIVESPAKVKTIKKFLGSGYEVTASQGHVRDLPKSSMGIDIDKDFEPKYITIRGKGEILSALRKEVKKADNIYLATDPDREGEAISWHLYAALSLENKKCYRITFNEITKNAVKESLKHPREIDMNLVDAQQARRVIDRIVGYSISPVMWAKVKRGLSAGRVQSAALHMVCDRESEIDAFIPEEYWTLDAILNIKGEKKPLTAKYYGVGNDKAKLVSKADADKVMEEVKNEKFVVTDVNTGTRQKKPPLPFTTSTLQQEAGKILNFSTSKTMSVAQQLYEGVEIKGEGTVGIITYLRTDSTRVSDEAQAQAEKYLADNFAPEYSAGKTESRDTGKRIQDAHEAIRPTLLARNPESIKGQLSRDQYKLYRLIWQRFLASCMTPAVYETLSIKIAAGKHIFTVSSSRLTFDGYRKVYIQSDDTEDEKSLDSSVSEKSVLKLSELDPRQHFTQPPAHYTESSLVRALEEQGIGRPSTYAPTITTLIKRRYITKEQKNLYVTDIGYAVDDLMGQAFPSIVDAKFTANIESLLDGVEEGDVKWKTIIRNFYPDLKESVDKANEELEKVEIRDEESDEICEKCGRRMVIKYGPSGKFLACPGYPDCKNTKPYYEKTGIACPVCGSEVVVKITRKGRKYYGCMGYPECEFMSWDKPAGKTCSKCGKYMVIKGKKAVCSDKECGYSENLENAE
ncbi:MAG: type I DNA topoisomerase [Lachnospiraceae bacterium]|nr:type I DNA topoisomerase [Lachnospiraceae bacterium]